MKYHTKAKEIELFKTEIESVSSLPFDEYILHAIDHQNVREAIINACYEDNGGVPLKKYIDNIFTFSIVKFINKDKEVFYHLYGYSEFGDEVEFGVRSTLKEVEELLEYYSQSEPDFQIINESNVGR